MGSRPDPGKPSRGWYAAIMAIAILSSSIIAFYIQGGMTDLEQLNERKQQLQKEHEQLLEQAKELKIRRRRLHEDPHLIEDLARDRLGMARPGEKAVSFRETGSETTESDTSAGDIPTDTGPLEQQTESDTLPFVN